MTDWNWMQDQERQAKAYGLSDLLPDPPLTNKYSDLKEWVRQCRRGPVTLWGMLEAYRRGYRDARLEGIRLGLEAAMKTVCSAEVKAARELAESGDSHCPAEGRFAGLAEATDLIRALDPETIAKEDDQ